MSSDRIASWVALLIVVVALWIALSGEALAAPGKPHPKINCSLEIRQDLPQCKNR